jgi:hypothetical protein
MALSIIDMARPVPVPSARGSTRTRARMILQRVTSAAGYVGDVAVITAFAISLSAGASSPHAVAGGSGDRPRPTSSPNPACRRCRSIRWQ